jgi:protein-disulfide isomerase
MPAESPELIGEFWNRSRLTGVFLVSNVVTLQRQIGGFLRSDGRRKNFEEKMKTKGIGALCGLVMLGFLTACTGQAQSQSNDDLKKDIQNLKDGQQAIQKDLQEIKKLLAARPAAAAPTEQALNAIISVDGEPFKGDKNAKLTLVEFSEFQCPFCGRHVRDTFPQLDKEYIQTGKVKYVFSDLPLESIHKNAFKASEAAHCAGEQNKFWEMHDRLFANQNAIEPANLTAHAQAIGADTKKFQACLDSGKYSAEIRKNIAEANKYGIQGTPTFVIGLTQPNDPKTIKVLKVIRGAQNIAAFKEALDSLANEKAPVEKKAEKQ